MINIWKTLGIEPTTDKRTIKKAYAEAVKKCHPEEHPEEFKALYAAYQAALGNDSHDMQNDVVIQINPSDTHQGTLAIQRKIPQEPDSQNNQYEELFMRNNAKKQTALTHWSALKRRYLKEQSPQNNTAFVQFLLGDEFDVIKDMDRVVEMASDFLTKNEKAVSKDIAYALWKAYNFEEYDERRIDISSSPVLKKLYEKLKTSNGKYIRLENGTGRTKKK